MLERAVKSDEGLAELMERAFPTKAAAIRELISTDEGLDSFVEYAVAGKVEAPSNEAKRIWREITKTEGFISDIIKYAPDMFVRLYAGSLHRPGGIPVDDATVLGAISHFSPENVAEDRANLELIARKSPNKEVREAAQAKLNQ